MKIDNYQKRMGKIVGYYVLLGLVIIPKLILFLFDEASYYWLIKLIAISNFYLSGFVIFSWLVFDKKMYPKNKNDSKLYRNIFILSITTLAVLTIWSIENILELTHDTFWILINGKPYETTITVERTNRHQKGHIFGNQSIYTESNERYQLFYTSSYMKAGETYKIQFLERSEIILTSDLLK